MTTMTGFTLSLPKGVEMEVGLLAALEMVGSPELMFEKGPPADDAPAFELRIDVDPVLLADALGIKESEGNPEPPARPPAGTPKIPDDWGFSRFALEVG